jgi:hypothetical protein
LKNILKEYNEKPHECDRCHSKFSYQNTLKKHYETCVGDTRKSDSYKITNITNDNSVNTNNNTTNNITNNINNDNSTNYNITVNNFGSENIDHILADEAFLRRCLLRLKTDGIPNLVERIYLDINKPENNTVLFERERYPGLLLVLEQDDMYEKNEWNKKSIDTVSHRMIDRGGNIMNGYNERETHPEDSDAAAAQSCRREQLIDILSHKKGVYGPMKCAIVEKVKKFTDIKNNQTES